ncbi:unnamed protein product [Echinostoma caproni]|uniref:WD_REPEATS_REGION domain-containing protein n=1 Tax=Echinostoma caproni TaxID=27848 RepID=A0A183ACT1_9TREM|nr:unnamed protein product [Echinostoma caproni]
MDSVPAILTLVFQHVEKIEYHVWVLESFLSKKKELHKDLLMIIAYGPTEARLPAVCLLFHYWPETYPSVFHGNQTLQPVHYSWEPWKPLTCDRTDCPNKAGKALAMKMTVNPRISAQHGGKPPPLYVCLDCADALNRRDFDQLVDILLPSKQMPVPEVWDMALDLQSCMVEAVVSLTRETMPRWRQVLLGGGDASDDRAVAGLTCTGSNPPGGPPAGGDMILLGVSTSATATGLSMVGGGATVPGGLGSTGPGGGVGPAGLGLTGSTHPEFTTSQANASSSRGIAGLGGNALNASTEAGELSLIGRYSDEDHKVLAVYGALLVGEKCKPRECVNIELLTRITAGIFKWFVDTIYTAEDELGDLLERVKSEYILKWIQEVQRLHPEAVFAVLLPHPLEYARIGSCWDALCDRTTQVKHGLSRIGSLIPYDIVTFETWDFVMPYWLETIRTEVPRSEYFELEVLLKKIFDATAGPFPFLPQKVYHFAAERFTNTPVAVQDQALAWLEILTSVEVPIPMKELLTMFRNGVESFQIEILLPPSTIQYDGDEDLNVKDESSDESEIDPHELSVDLTETRVDDNPLPTMDVEGEDDDYENLVQSSRRRSIRLNSADKTTKRYSAEDGGSPAVSEEEEDDAPAPDETVGLLGTSRGTSVTASLRKARKPLRRKREVGPRSKSNVARTESGLRIQEEFAHSQQLSRSNRTRSQPRQSNALADSSGDAAGIGSSGLPGSSRSGLVSGRRRQSRTRSRPAEVREYRATECLAQMLNIAYRQVSAL